MRIFVTGASGFVGSVFISKLKERLAETDSVDCLVRTRPNGASPRFNWLLGSLETIELFEKEISEADYVFHIAANATFGGDADYDATNFFPTQKLVQILKKSERLKNFIFISTIGAVDRHPKDRCHQPLTTSHIPSPRSDYGASKLKAELEIQASGLPHTIIRPTWVYGPNMRAGSHINQFATMISKSRLLPRLGFPGHVSVIHVEDLGVALVHCLDNQKILGKTYFAETEGISFGKLFQLIDSQIHPKKVFQLKIPGLRFLLSRLHRFLPMTLICLFLDYLYAKDENFKEDLEIGRTKRLEDSIHEVIETNPIVSGVTIITGANSGIGLALASEIAEKKRLVLVDKDISNLKNFSSSLVIQADLTEKNSIAQIVDQIHGPIFCLINNAGIGIRGNLDQIPEEEITNVFLVNVIAPMRLTKKLLPKLKKDHAVIINIASSVAHHPLPGMALYSASKAAMSNWSESLSYELRLTNKVVTFSPSGTYTNFQRNSGVKILNEGKGLHSPKTVARRILATIDGKKTVVIFAPLVSRLLILASRLLPKPCTIQLWGRLFERYR